MNDSISRLAALNGKISIQRTDGLEIYSDEAMPVEYLKRLSSARPERKTGWVHIDDIYRLIAGHSNYHGDNILAALTCLAEGKEVPNPIAVLEPPGRKTGKWIRTAGDYIGDDVSGFYDYHWSCSECEREAIIWEMENYGAVGESLIDFNSNLIIDKEFNSSPWLNWYINDWGDEVDLIELK